MVQAPAPPMSAALLEGTTEHAASNGVVAAEPRCPRAKQIGKALLDNMPGLIGFGFAFAKSTLAIYVLCWCSVFVAIIALGVDFFLCRRRWAAGLEAVFPKMITVTYLLMTAVVLGLLYGGVLTAHSIIGINGCIITGGLFFGSLASLIIREPWIYAIAVEVVSPERMQEIRSTPQGMQVFRDIMAAITTLWTAVFFVLFCMNVALATWYYYGGSQAATSMYGNVGGVSVTLFAVKCLQPKVIQAAREKAMERGADSSGNRV